MTRLEREINSEVRARFDAGAVRRVAVLQHDDDPAIEPDELLVRVFIETADEPADQRALEEWARARQAGMRRMRRELSLRLPEARLLEFAIDSPGTGARITMPDDPALTNERPSPRETVETALALLRRSYVFPERAERAAEAIEARLAAGEYDGLDDDALAERLTGQLQEICDDKHLRVRTMPPRPARAEPGRPGRPPLGHGPGRGDRRPLNYGIFGAQRLDGNVGYLDVRPRGGRAGHRRGDGTDLRHLRADHRPAAQPWRLAQRGGAVVQLLLPRRQHPPQRHLRRRHRGDQAVLEPGLGARRPLHRPAGLRADQPQDVLRR
jgi:hypothetical protein